MCSECLRAICPPECPNYCGRVVRQCIKCGAEIYEYEDYYEVDGDALCDDCFDKYVDSCRRIGEWNSEN